MTISNGDVLAAILAIVSALVWLVRLEARITRADERHEDLRKGFYRLRDRLDEGKVYVFRKPPHAPVPEGDEDA
jgi:hypothetical protein